MEGGKNITVYYDVFRIDKIKIASKRVQQMFEFFDTEFNIAIDRLIGLLTG